VIRAARPDELRALSELAWRSKAHWGYSDDFMSACRAELTVSEACLEHAFVEEADQQLVGFYALSPLDATRAELAFLFVEPAEIGAGHGRALLEHALEHARAQGFGVLVIQGDPNAAEFYVRCGALKVGERPSDSIPGRMLPLFELPIWPVL
jgi:GNAT superfamily N-acetyltransferase